MDGPDLTPLQRIALAFWAFFAALFRRDAALALAQTRAQLGARRAAGVPGAGPVAARAEPAPAPRPVESSPPHPQGPSPEGISRGAALQLLAALQREGRLVDFIEEDVAGFPDAAVGAAARTVHAGCKRALQELFRLEPVLREPEGATVEIRAGFDPAAVRLTGNVVGQPPFKGSLRHHGWRAREVKLPRAGDGIDPSIVAPAEVEL